MRLQVVAHPAVSLRSEGLGNQEEPNQTNGGDARCPCVCRDTQATHRGRRGLAALLCPRGRPMCCQYLEVSKGVGPIAASVLLPVMRSIGQLPLGKSIELTVAAFTLTVAAFTPLCSQSIIYLDIMLLVTSANFRPESLSLSLSAYIYICIMYIYIYIFV